MSLSPATLRAWVHAGKLPRHGSGRVLRVQRAQLHALLAEQGRAAPTARPADEEAMEILHRQAARGRHTKHTRKEE